MRPGATALAVLVAPLIALPLAVVVGGAADLVASGDRPDFVSLALLAVVALTAGYLPAALVVAVVLVPLSRALAAAGAVGLFSYAAGGVFTAVPVLLVLPTLEPLLAELLLDGYSAPVFWATTIVVGSMAGWLGFWLVLRPDVEA